MRGRRSCKHTGALSALRGEAFIKIRRPNLRQPLSSRFDAELLRSIQQEISSAS